MNILKIQQELMAEIHDAEFLVNGNAKPPRYIYLDNGLTMLVNCMGTVAYILPVKWVYIRRSKFLDCERCPIPLYKEGEWTELTNTGITYTRQGNRSPCALFDRAGQKVALDKNLLKPFDKRAKFYQENDLGPVAVLENGVTVGYVMPVRLPKENQ